MFLNSGKIDLDSRSNNGKTPRGMPCSYNHLGIAKALLNAGAHMTLNISADTRERTSEIVKIPRLIF